MPETTRQLNVRVPASLIEELESIAREEHMDRTTVTRRLLADGISHWRLDRAIRAYQEGRVSKERAAEMADVSLYQLLDELRQRGVPAQYSVFELREDIALLRERAGTSTS